MDFFRFVPIFILGFVVVCHAFPFPQNDVNEENEVDKDVAPRYGVQSANQNSQSHRLPDRPRAPAPNPGPGCRIEYETKYEIEDVESTRQECSWTTENRCTTKTRDKCTAYKEKVCDTKYQQKCRNWTDRECKDTWRNECSTRTKEECNDYSKPVQIPYEEDECITRKERRCEKHWEEPIKGKKVWVDNPATCKDYDTTDCRPVTKYRTEQEKYTKCDQVPYQHCERVKDTNCRNVPKQKCEDVPYQDCYDVPREKCVPESWQDCQDYPKKRCENVHSLTPKQIAKQVPIRVCGNRREKYNDGGNFDGSSVFDIRNGNDNNEHDPEDDAEVIAFGQQQVEEIDPGLLEQKVKDVVKKKSDPKKDGEDDTVTFG